MPMFEVLPGVSLHYVDEGEGDRPPLVLIPGWTFTTQVFVHQIERFSANRRVIAIDPRSHGLSTVTTTGNNYVTQGTDLRALIEHLSIEKPVLLGWSFGCLTAWEYVETHGPESVSGIVTVDLSPTPMTETPNTWREGSIGELAEGYQLLGTVAGQIDFVTGSAKEVMLQKDVSPETLEWLINQSLATPPWAAAAYFAAGMFSNYAETVQRIDGRIPALCFVAEHWSEVAKQTLAAITPAAEIEVKGGHMMFWEYADEFNDRLAQFLTKA
ncbi:MAG: alpha/beta hydrolase [Pseudomonadota bacterium]